MLILLSLFCQWNISLAAPVTPLMEDAHALLVEARAIQPGWTDRLEELSLEWGEHLYLALNLLRLGQNEMAEAGKESLLETLGELNLRVHLIPDASERSAVATVAIAEVGEMMRDKFGTIGRQERALMTVYLNDLSLKVSERDVLIAAGRAAVAPELTTRRQQRNLRVWGNVVAPLGAVVTCALTLLVPSPWKPVHAFQYVTSAASIYAAMKFYVVTRDLGRQVVAQPAPDDPNYVFEPVARVRQLFSGRGPAATPSAVSRAG